MARLPSPLRPAPKLTVADRIAGTLAKAYRWVIAHRADINRTSADLALVVFSLTITVIALVAIAAIIYYTKG